jgi:hypothetical protein
MKTTNKYVLSAMIIAFLMVNTESFAQVGIGTTTPDDSSMLDIQSDAKGVLIPRMTTAQRTPGISSPANGLLVFDTTTKSFWFYNLDVWKELTSGSSLIDDDGDTRVEVEQSADEDIIRFTTVGTEYMQIGSNGDIKLGNRAASTLTGGVADDLESDTTLEQNYTKITADGSLSYVGNATRWEDLKVPVNAVKIKAKKDNEGVEIDPPDWAGFIEGASLGLLWFKNEGSLDKEQEVVFTVQMPHGWKQGTNIFPHVHWSAGKINEDGELEDDSTAPGTNRVTWGLEYTWAIVGEVFPGTTIITGTTVATPNTGSIALYEHVITPLGTGGIVATGKTLSSMLVCRLFRNSSAGTDTYNGEAGLLEIDFHYQIDSDGSNQEYTKE